MAFTSTNALQLLMLFALSGHILGQTISCNNRAYICTGPNEYKLCLPSSIAKIFENTPTKCPSGSKCNNDDPTPCGGKSSISKSEDGTIITISSNSSKSSGNSASSSVVTGNHPDEHPKSNGAHKTSPKLIKTTPKLIKTTPKVIKTTPKSSKTTPKKIIPKTTPKSIDARCPSPAKIADPNNCHVFYICNGLEKHRIICPFNTVFNQVSQTCERNIDICQRNEKFTCPRAGRFADPKSCYHFYQCQREGGVYNISRKQCPSQHSFSVVEQKCVRGGRGCSNKLFPEEVDEEELEIDEESSEFNDDF